MKALPIWRLMVCLATAVSLQVSFQGVSGKAAQNSILPSEQAAEQDRTRGASDNAAVPGPPLNPNAIAILRWYPINQVTRFSTLVSQVAGIAFDGANMWVTGNLSNTVSKLRASDGKLLGTFAVGSGPFGLAFDGADQYAVTVKGKGSLRLLGLGDLCDERLSPGLHTCRGGDDYRFWI